MTVTLSGVAPSHATGDLEIDGALNHDGSTVGLFGTAPTAQPAAVPDFTNNTGVAGDSTVQNVPAATASIIDSGAASLASTNAALTAIENNIADLADKFNVLLARIRAPGYIAT